MYKQLSFYLTGFKKTENDLVIISNVNYMYKPILYNALNFYTQKLKIEVFFQHSVIINGVTLKRTELQKNISFLFKYHILILKSKFQSTVVYLLQYGSTDIHMYICHQLKLA